MSAFLLEVHTRTKQGKAVQSLRRSGVVPGIIYGHHSETLPLEVALLPLQQAWRDAGESSLIDVQIDDRPPVKAIIHDLQLDPRTNRILHVDFHQVDMKEKVEVDVSLNFVGDSPAVKELGGTLIKLRDEIKIQCLPSDLVKEINVDIGSLKTFDDVIRIQDLPIPQGLEVLANHDDLIAQVEPPRSEEELAELDKAVEEDVSKVEKVEAPKKEEGEEEVSEQPAATAKTS